MPLKGKFLAAYFNPPCLDPRKCLLNPVSPTAPARQSRHPRSSMASLPTSGAVDSWATIGLGRLVASGQDLEGSATCHTPF